MAVQYYQNQMQLMLAELGRLDFFFAHLADISSQCITTLFHHRLRMQAHSRAGILVVDAMFEAEAQMERVIEGLKGSLHQIMGQTEILTYHYHMLRVLFVQESLPQHEQQLQELEARQNHCHTRLASHRKILAALLASGKDISPEMHARTRKLQRSSSRASNLCKRKRKVIHELKKLNKISAAHLK